MESILEYQDDISEEINRKPEKKGEDCEDDASEKSNDYKKEEQVAQVLNGSRGRGRGRGRGGGGIAIEGMDEIDNPLPSGFGAKQFFDGNFPLEFGAAAARGRGRGIRGRGRGRGDSKQIDWTCDCGNVNWGWRMECNKCQSAKPATLVGPDEVRDGLGGGFNERQDRVSLSTVEVGEDGYDDFGRKIKKAKSARHLKEQAALARLHASFGGGMFGGVAGLDPLAALKDPAQFESADEENDKSFVQKRANETRVAIDSSKNEKKSEEISASKDSEKCKEHDRRDRSSRRSRSKDGERNRRRESEKSKEWDRHDKERRSSRSKDRERRERSRERRSKDRDQEKDRNRRERSDRRDRDVDSGSRRDSHRSRMHEGRDRKRSRSNSRGRRESLQKK